MFHFPQITWLAESLSVALLIPSATHDWDNVVKHKIVCGVTPKAFCIGPVLALPTRKAVPVTLLISWLRRLVVPMGHHLVTVNAPMFPDSGTHSSTCLRGMPVAFWWGHSLFPVFEPRCRNAFTHFWGMILAPERVSVALHGLAFTFRRTAGLGDASGYLRTSAVEHFAAHRARELPASSSPRTNDR